MTATDRSPAALALLEANCIRNDVFNVATRVFLFGGAQPLGEADLLLFKQATLVVASDGEQSP